MFQVVYLVTEGILYLPQAVYFVNEFVMAFDKHPNCQKQDTTLCRLDGDIMLKPAKPGAHSGKL